MNKVKKILAPTDLSELSRLGVRYGLELAHGWGAEVTVYHVADPAELANYKAHSIEDLIKKHKNSLTQFLNGNFADLLASIKVQEKVEVGVPATSVLAEATMAGSDLIVMSTHGRTGIAHMLLGSVTEQVMRNAPCPVFSVHPPRSPSKAAG